MFKAVYETNRTIFFAAVVCSLLVSIWAGIVSDVINNDGIEYIKSARAMLAGEWQTALEIYKWPFYPGLLALISKITSLSLPVAAAAVNSVAFVVLTLAFLALLRLLGGDSVVLWFGLFCVVTLPPLTKILSFVVRDPAFLALFLSATFYFFRYYLERKPSDNVLAMVGYLVSAMFRIEGLIFLAASQAYLLLARLVRDSGRKTAVVIFLVLFTLALILISWWQFSPDGNLTYLSIFTQPVQFLETAWDQALKDIGRRMHTIREHILVGYSSSYTFTLFVLSAATIVGIEIIDSLYVVYFFMFVAAWRAHTLFVVDELRRPWRFMAWVGVLILMGFVFEQWFLTDRYPLAVALLVLLVPPFLLARLYAAYRARTPSTSRTAFMMIVPLMVIMLFHGLDLASDNRYLKQAGLWLHDNVEPTARVYTNNRRVTYYYGKDTHIDPYWPGWQAFGVGALAAKPHFDYLAIEVRRAHPDYAVRLPNLLGTQPVATFRNARGAQVVIYRFYQPHRAPSG